MKKTSTRRILQVPVGAGIFQGSHSSADPISLTKNGSSETNVRRNSTQPTPLIDSSTALTILVLFTVLCFMGFFSIYISRCGEEDSADIRRRRHPSSAPLQKSSGVDPAVIQSLPLVSYCGGAKQLITDCPICLSEFEEREMVKLIPRCRHVFHPHCVDTWLASHVSCPMCRTTQFFSDQVCLDVKEEVNCNCNGASELGGRPTVDDCDTWSEVGLRRTCSGSSLTGRFVLQRSMSF